MSTPTSTNDEWMSRFGSRLRALRSSIPDVDAAEVAQIAFAWANDLAPEEAAVVFAEILNAQVPVHDLKRWLRTKQSSR